MFEAKVKSFGKGGLHITLPKETFTLGETIKILKDEGWKKEVRMIVQEELENLKESMRSY